MPTPPFSESDTDLSTADGVVGLVAGVSDSGSFGGGTFSASGSSSHTGNILTDQITAQYSLHAETSHSSAMSDGAMFGDATAGLSSTLLLDSEADVAISANVTLDGDIATGYPTYLIRLVRTDVVLPPVFQFTGPDPLTVSQTYLLSAGTYSLVVSTEVGTVNEPAPGNIQSSLQLSFDMHIVPEPSTLTLCAFGFVTFVGLGWRRRKR
jgi:hypothetical protein